MTDNELERMLSQTLSHDASIGTEAFRDSLLARCLAVLNAGVGEDEGVELTDDQLVLLSAAGDPAQMGCATPEWPRRPIDVR